MGLSASQARFLQLTARKSNVEYQAQRINFERLQLADKSAAASAEYNEKMSNRKLTYTFNTGAERETVDVTYQNYKSIMNQQAEGLSTTGKQMFLVSSSGSKIIVGSEDEIVQMIEANPEKGFTKDDFMIAPDLDDVDNFQKAIQDGIYYFATFEKDEDKGTHEFKTLGWDGLEAGAISEVYDKSDDAAAQSEYDKVQSQIESLDKKLELQLNKLETERSAIETELESVEKIIGDNIDSSFKIFS
ncbi:MAG: hypothetical protein IJ877_06350 [Candidatus Gastranaerophilales bacterium]|nr:hypothetical protein [Candidatus Gastranaerophilales bacterium]